MSNETTELVHVGRAKAAPKAEPETIGSEAPSEAPVETPAAPPVVEVAPVLASPAPAPQKKKKKKKKLPPPPVGFLGRLREMFSTSPKTAPPQQIGGKAPPNTKKTLQTLVLLVVAAKVLEK